MSFLQNFLGASTIVFASIAGCALFLGGFAGKGGGFEAKQIFTFIGISFGVAIGLSLLSGVIYASYKSFSGNENMEEQ